MNKEQELSQQEISTLANLVTYRIQDILDDLSSGYSFNFSKEEKEIKKLIKAYLN